MDRRTKTYRDLARATPTTSELLSDEIDGEVFQYRRVPQCRVCTAPDPIREMIDSLLLFPKGYMEILRIVRPIQEEQGVPEKQMIKYESIRLHSKRHLPMDKALVREIVERRAQDKGVSILDATGRMLTAEAFYELVAQKSFQRIVEGKEQPSIRDGMAAMHVLQGLEKEAEGAVSVTTLLAQLNVVIEAVRAVCSPEQMAQISDLIENSRSQKALEPVGEDLSEEEFYESEFIDVD